MRTTYIKLIVSISLAVLTLGLSACSKPPTIATPINTHYRPISPYQENLLSKIHASGIHVVRQGDGLRMIIPIDRFFIIPGTKLIPSKTDALKDVGLFVKSYASIYAHPVIRVYGFTNRVYARKTRSELSRQYAKIVASYLWNAGISLSRLNIKGFGAKLPIATNRTPEGSALNRRVEIRVTFN